MPLSSYALPQSTVGFNLAAMRYLRRKVESDTDGNFFGEARNRMKPKKVEEIVWR